MSGPIHHVLFDADGVIQELPGGWYAAMEPYLGERAREFLHTTWREEHATLAGKGDYIPLLARRLVDFGVTVPVERVYADVWHRIRVHAEPLAVIGELRAAGIPVHLATNQESNRAAYMKAALDYQSRFDECFYSCDLGIAKPDPGFFVQIALRLATDPAGILFIDDSAENVDGARRAGLSAIRWTFSDGMDALRAALGEYGIGVGGPSGK